MLHSQVMGAGPPLVLLHGLFGAGENLRVLAKQLASRREVHMVDLPNHGQSLHTEHINYIMMSDAVAEYAQTLGRPVAVAGHSMGGKVAMCTALRAPDLVTHLVVLDIAPRSYNPSHEALMAALRSLNLQTLDSRGEADERLSGAIPSSAVRSFLLKNLAQDDRGFRWKLNLPVLQRDYAHILGWPQRELTGMKYENPTLFIAGGRSDYLKPERDHEEIARWFPTAEIAVVDDAGHWIHADAPHKVIEHMTAVLESLA